MQEVRMHLLNQRMCLLGKINNEASYLLSIGFGKLIYKYCLKRGSICYTLTFSLQSISSSGVPLLCMRTIVLSRDEILGQVKGRGRE